MIRNKNFTIRSWTKSMFMLCLAAGVTACDPQHIEEDMIEAQALASDHSRMAAPSTKVISMANINLTVSQQATGTVTLQLRDSTGTLIATTSRDVGFMASKGKPTWYTFLFHTHYEAVSNTKLRLYLTRSDAHNVATRNTVYVSTSLTDDYVNGESSITGKDISFITYTDKEDYFLTDQVQARVRDKQPLQQNSFVWQEFTFGTNTGAPVDLLTSASLNLSGSPTGELSIWITNGQGTEVLEQTKIYGMFIVPIGGEGWSYSPFSNPLIVSRGQKYRLQFMYHAVDPREAPLRVGHVIGFESAYPFGASSLTGDFAFMTETDNGIDQQMDLFTYRYSMVSDQVYWQEFVPGAH